MTDFEKWNGRYKKHWSKAVADARDFRVLTAQE